MLAVMTYNAWLFLSVVFGSATGYFLCSYINLRHRFQIQSTSVARRKKDDGEGEDKDLEENIEMLSKATRETELS